MGNSDTRLVLFTVLKRPPTCYVGVTRKRSYKNDGMDAGFQVTSNIIGWGVYVFSAQITYLYN